MLFQIYVQISMVLQKNTTLPPKARPNFKIGRHSLPALILPELKLPLLTGRAWTFSEQRIRTVAFVLRQTYRDRGLTTFTSFHAPHVPLTDLDFLQKTFKIRVNCRGLEPMLIHPSSSIHPWASATTTRVPSHPCRITFKPHL